MNTAMKRGELEKALEALDDGTRVWSTGAFIFREDMVLLASVLTPSQMLVYAVGGRVEEGEDLRQALVREGREEASIELSPIDAERTCFLLEGDRPELVVLPRDLAPRPSMVWTGPVPTPRGEADYLCTVFTSGFSGKPRPGAEIDRLLWIRTGDAAAPRLDLVEVLGGPAAPNMSLSLTGTAARIHQWVETRCARMDRRLADALDRGHEILARYGAHPMLIQHSRKVTQAALSVGRRLVDAGMPLQLDRLILAAMTHDVGKAGSAVRAQHDHARVSAEILTGEGLGDLAPAVANHPLPVIADGGLREDLLERVLFYADKVVSLEYLGIDERLEDLARRHPSMASFAESTRGPLHDLQAELAAAAGMSVRTLEHLCYLAALSEEPSPV